ncbi:beta-ketoacyl synthase chain length factor [Marinobacter mangrovi]|uniref:beta-ketoacyl synthase chain length factor n=1 Tax=Marinobacter mangrovi TaxID=2803918 RepID=UPI0019330DA6|nr:beta-ketoacyl synthase chain length factor [Marinobacter mangrovi]
MQHFKIEKWSALAPGLEHPTEWQSWLKSGSRGDAQKVTFPTSFPAPMKRRLSAHGKLSAAAALSCISEDEQMPTVFASRHGDVNDTLKLLATLGADDYLSPTRFSMSVHNAMCGILSIARKDPSAVTAISSMNDLLLATLIEAVSQLPNSPRVLCIICDSPLPEPYPPLPFEADFPWAMSFIVSRESGDLYQMELTPDHDSANTPNQPLNLVGLLTGLSNTLSMGSGAGRWILKRQGSARV